MSRFTKNSNKVKKTKNEKEIQRLWSTNSFMMKALESLPEEKRNYREEKHAIARTCQKWTRKLVKCLKVSTRASVETEKEQQESIHQVIDDNLIENFQDRTSHGISDGKDFQKKRIILDQQNLADKIQESCSVDN